MPDRGHLFPPRHAALAAAVALVAALGLVGGCGHAILPPSAPNSMMGKRVTFALPSNSGALVSVPAKGARFTVLDFFSPSCKPCKEKLPALYAKRDALSKKGAQLMLVAVLGDEPTDDATQALASWGVTNAPFLVDHGDVSRASAAVRGLPATLILDRDGTLRWAAPPTATAEQVVDAVP